MKRLLIFISLVLAFFTLSAAPLAHADTNDFTITSFTADETLSRADPQGQLHIVEHIQVDFRDHNHGILRAIPQKYKNHSLHLHVNGVTSDSGAAASYTTYTQSDNTVLKIGDADRTVTGRQEYTIDYTMRNVVTFYDDHDELYWDINGDDWAQPFTQVTARLHLPADVSQTRNPVCYAGSFGTKAYTCKIDMDANNHLLTAQTLKPLDGFQTLSVVVGFKKGYFHPSTLMDTVSEYRAHIIGFGIAFLIMALPAGLLWFRYGRDPKGRGVIVPQYDAPEGLGPIEVGTLIDFRTDNKDITAAIIDLAIRRYITIVEDKQKHALRGDKTVYTLRLEKTGYGELNEFERNIMDALFGRDTAPGEYVDLSAQKFKMASTATVLRTTVRASLEQRGYFRHSPIGWARIGRGILFGIVLFIGAIIAQGFDASTGYTIGAFAGFSVAFFFLVFLSSRTPKGVEANEHVQGLKLYLQVAEADRIKMLQSPDARYAANTGNEPVRTVELFEKLLPYAMILGVEKQWAKQFEHIYNTPPQWYNGSWNTFNAVYLASSLSSGMSQAVNTAFSSPSSSSGSGFGGGGAGGGGGGGGGGGW